MSTDQKVREIEIGIQIYAVSLGFPLLFIQHIPSLILLTMRHTKYPGHGTKIS